ncbi:MAG: FixH family protein [Acidobacteriaceae bacterium]|nr:FixH family protein [Acidobacteriaceae bacterium]MBV9442011.1 FixH family protein [Acidobacteriaceae bacterium]
MKWLAFEEPAQNGRSVERAAGRAAGFYPCLGARSRALCALVACAFGLLFAQERPGNFQLRLEPTAVLQANAPIPFRITVKDALGKPLIAAKVTLQIETPQHEQAKVFQAPAIDQGVYMAKPVFPSAGLWNVYVEARRNDEMTARTSEYNVRESLE